MTLSRFLALYMAIAFLFAAPAPVFAASPHIDEKCIAECMQKSGNQCDLAYSSGFKAASGEICYQYARPCEHLCVLPEGIKYGALAYDKSTGGWGLSDESAKQDVADATALYYCRPNGKHCKVVAHFVATCVAVAYGEDNTMAWSPGATVDEAADKALKACGEKTSSPCSVKGQNCFPGQHTDREREQEQE